jgi:hypothetical protein
MSSIGSFVADRAIWSLLVLDATPNAMGYFAISGVLADVGLAPKATAKADW